MDCKTQALIRSRAKRRRKKKAEEAKKKGTMQEDAEEEGEPQERKRKQGDQGCTNIRQSKAGAPQAVLALLFPCVAIVLPFFVCSFSVGNSQTRSEHGAKKQEPGPASARAARGKQREGALKHFLGNSELPSATGDARSRNMGCFTEADKRRGTMGIRRRMAQLRITAKKKDDRYDGRRQAHTTGRRMRWREHRLPMPPIRTRNGEGAERGKGGRGKSGNLT